MKLVTLSITLLCGLCLPLMAQTSETNARLEEALKQFPKADADKNGVLTLEEARAFQMKNRAKSAGKGQGRISEPDRNVAYKSVDERRLVLHVFEPENHKQDARVPAVVFFHGGGWKNGNPLQLADQCRYLAGRGMVAITAEYRLTTRPGIKINDCVEDAKSAMRWVRGHAAELGIDPSRIAAGGGSAGGHLAACTALVDTHDATTDDKSVSAKPDAMILFNPAMITAPDPRAEKQGFTPNKRKPEGDGKTDESPLAGRIRGEATAISPLAHAKKKQPPCIMFFGTEDRLLQPAEWFRDDSVAAGNRCRIITYEGQGHSFFNQEPYTGKTLEEVDRFLVGLGWLRAK
jgi:acetyl esterase/lipase